MAYDAYELQRQLDKVKSRVFQADNSAFLGALMCRLKFSWNSRIPTAGANMLELVWNPTWFESLSPKTRETVLVHELWHPAKLHMLRQGKRDQKLFNIACDIDINNGLEAAGYSFEGVEWAWRNSAQQVRDLGLSWPLGTPPEQIYDDLLPHTTECAAYGSWGDPGGEGDMKEPPKNPDDGQGDGDQDLGAKDKTTVQDVVNAVMQAANAARLAQQPGAIPGDIIDFLDRFLKPVIPWEVLLHRFMQDLCNPDFDWAVRDRRFLEDDDTYLPGEKEQNERLQHLAWIIDTSASFTNAQLDRANSEMKHTWDTYQPHKMTQVQFDTKIRKITVLEEGADYTALEVKGRGGTDIKEVREWMVANKVTAAVVFTDLDFEPMEPISPEIPIIWICVDNPDPYHLPTFGQIVHIEA